MKNNYKFCGLAMLAVAFLGVVSCQSEIEEDLKTDYSDGEVPEVTAYAPGYSPDTKTVIKNETEVWWQAGDAINVFWGDDTDLGKFESLGTKDKQCAVFMGKKPFAMGTIAPGSTSKFWGIYPYAVGNTCDNESVTLTVPSVQTAVAGSFDPKAFPSVATSNDLTFAFYNVCGGLRFSVTKAGVKSVTFKGNNGEYIAGKVKVSMDDSGKPIHEVVEGRTEVVLTSPDSLAVGSWYYISLLPGSLTSGYTLSFDTADQYAVKTTSSSVTVKRSIFGSMENADEGLTYSDNLVDLGLSVKWAKRNLGASVPEAYGLYYQWGDTQGYGSNTSDGKSFGLSSYKWCNGTSNTLTKYNTKSDYGTVDNKTVLEMDDDASRAAFGESWRMPTDAEWTELRDTANCTWTWSTLNGVNGYKVQSRKTGYTDNWIFLPAAGGRYFNYLGDVGSYGYYWSSSLGTGFPDRANGVLFGSSDVTGYNTFRCLGRSIRPISGPLAASVTLDNTSLNLEVGDTYTLTATVAPDNTLRRAWYSSDPSVATVDSNGKVVAVSCGAATITVLSGGLTATCTINVIAEPTEIDLGLSVKWASCNLGAVYPEDYGFYYQWGDTVGYGSSTSDGKYFNWRDAYGNVSYKWCNGSETTLTKYNNKIDYGTVDNKTVLEMDDDAARVALGESWRMPKYTEWTELRDTSNCTWTWTTLSGVDGYKVQSRKTGYADNWIFLPAAGRRDNGGLYDVGAYGTYWTSSLEPGTYLSRFVGFGSGSIDRGDYARCTGLSIRPVSE